MYMYYEFVATTISSLFSPRYRISPNNFIYNKFATRNNLFNRANIIRLSEKLKFRTFKLVQFRHFY